MLVSTENLTSVLNWPHYPLKIFKENGIVKKAPFYSRWTNMIHRCYGDGKHAKWYKNRGIKICREWLDDYWLFHEWCVSTYEKGKTLDRIDNNGPYSPENCRWATQKQQMLNSRRHTKDKLNAVKKAKAGWWKHIDNTFGNPKTRKSKICSSCGKRKLNSHYHKRKAAGDGLMAYCKPCATVNRRKYKYASNE